MTEHAYTVSEKVLEQRAEAVERAMMLADEPVSAKSLASVCGVRGGHETLRRRVREAVTYARESKGLRVCANSRGYWLARNAEEWRDYRAATAAGARFTFVKLAGMQRRVLDRMSGQRRFDFAEVAR